MNRTQILIAAQRQTESCLQTLVESCLQTLFSEEMSFMLGCRTKPQLARDSGLHACGRVS